MPYRKTAVIHMTLSELAKQLGLPSDVRLYVWRRGLLYHPDPISFGVQGNGVPDRLDGKKISFNDLAPPKCVAGTPSSPDAARINDGS